MMASVDPTRAERIVTEPDPYDQFNRIGIPGWQPRFLSGQTSIDEHGEVVGVGDFDLQAEQTFENLRRVLEAAGSSLEKRIKVNIYLTDMGNFPKIVDLREKYFKQPWPGDTITGVTGLALPELMIEIEAVALVNGEVVG